MKKLLLIICVSAMAFTMACTDEGEDIDNLNPLAVITALDEVPTGESVVLSGSLSTDPEGEPLQYSWSFGTIPANSTAGISNPNQATASFTPDLDGTYEVKLTVSDGVKSGEGSFIITASTFVGLPPVVVIRDENGREFSESNDNILIGLADELIFTSAGSFDPEGGAITYAWSVKTQPAGSNPVIANSTTETGTFSTDMVGDYTVLLTLTDEQANENTAEVSFKVDFLPVILSEDISSVTTLPNVYDDPALLDYLVTKSTLNVNSDLTVMPGVSIAFEDNHGLYITTTGSIVAVGTATDSIVFKGEKAEKGFWRGIRMASNNSANKLQYVQLTDGGSEGFDGANLKANIMVEGDGKVIIANSRIENSGGTGVYVRNLPSQIPGFSSNVITNNSTPVTCTINEYHFLDGATDYTGNENDYILSQQGSATSEDVTWNKLNVPYRIVNNTQSISSAITVQPGAQFLGQSDSGLFIQEDGSLDATGTSAERIVFKGEQDTEGVWEGLGFESNNANNKLIYVDVMNGGQKGFDGANLKSNVIVEDNGRLIIQFSTFTKSGDAGVYLRSITSKLPDFSNNTMSGNNVPMKIHFNNWHYLDGNSSYSGNTNNFIDGLTSGTDITAIVSWKKLNVPYRIPSIREEITQGGVTVEAGVEIISRADGGLEASGDGYLRIDGSLTEPVIFRGEQNVTGYWRGLRFSSNNANNVITNATVSNGGSSGFDGANRKANIEVLGTLNATNLIVSLSGGFGIRIQSGGSLTGTGITYTGNIGGDTQNDN